MNRSSHVPGKQAEQQLYRLATAVAILTATYVAWRMLSSPAVGVDDANIFFVYARNLVHGHGIVYNVGSEHVEGFSSVLYLLVCSAVFAVSSAPELVLFALNLAFAVAAGLCVLRVLADLAAALEIGRVGRLLCVVGFLAWLVSNPLYFAWNVVSLMDTGLYSLVLTAGFTLLAVIVLRGAPPTAGHSRGLALLIVLTVLVRPEGVLWSLVLFAAFAAIAWPDPGTLKRLRLPFAALLLTPLALLVFRLNYFGYPFPNTYYAKVSASLLSTLGDGRRYFRVFEGFYGLWAVAPVCLLLLWIGYRLVTRAHRTRVVRFACLTALFSAVALLVPVLEGGDNFNGFRMYQPVYPLLFMPLLLAGLGITAAARHKRTLGCLLVALLAVALFHRPEWPNFKASNRVDRTPTDEREAIGIDFYLASTERANAAALRRLLQAGPPTVGMAAAGGFAFGYDGTVYDLLGLNDVRMAHADPVKTGPKGHQSFDKGVFFERSPDLVLPWMLQRTTADDLENYAHYFADPQSWDNKIFKGLFQDPQFQAAYTLTLLQDRRQPSHQWIVFIRRPYLDRLKADPQLVLHTWPAAG